MGWYGPANCNEGCCAESGCIPAGGCALHRNGGPNRYILTAEGFNEGAGTACLGLNGEHELTVDPQDPCRFEGDRWFANVVERNGEVWFQALRNSTIPGDLAYWEVSSGQASPIDDFAFRDSQLVFNPNGSFSIGCAAANAVVSVRSADTNCDPPWVPTVPCDVYCEDNTAPETYVIEVGDVPGGTPGFPPFPPGNECQDFFAGTWAGVTWGGLAFNTCQWQQERTIFVDNSPETSTLILEVTDDGVPNELRVDVLLLFLNRLGTSSTRAFYRALVATPDKPFDCTNFLVGQVVPFHSEDPDNAWDCEWPASVTITGVV